jgi:hypothetical protein
MSRRDRSLSIRAPFRKVGIPPLKPARKLLIALPTHLGREQYAGYCHAKGSLTKIALTRIALCSRLSPRAYRLAAENVRGSTTYAAVFNKSRLHEFEFFTRAFERGKEYRHALTAMLPQEDT